MKLSLRRFVNERAEMLGSDTFDGTAPDWWDGLRQGASACVCCPSISRTEFAFDNA